MERMGDDELFCIFTRLDEENDRKVFCQVSKQFMKVACSRLHELRNSFPDLLYDILPESPNLVSFHCSKRLTNSYMKLLAQSCPKLLHLMPNIEIDDSELLDQFESDFNDDGLCAVANACNRLTEVNLSGRLHVGDVGIRSVVNSCRFLTILKLGECVSVTDESLKAIGEAKRLRALNLQGCYLITDLGLKYLANGNGDLKNSLYTIVLSECDRISDNGIIYLKQMVSLIYLNLSNCGVNVTDSGIVELLSKCSNLQSLDLSWLINVTDISLFDISTKCLKLELIHLSGCEALTGEGLRAFAHHPTLEILDLNSCHKFSWEDVESLAMTCERLVYIILSRRIKRPSPDYFACKINGCLINFKNDQS